MGVALLLCVVACGDGYICSEVSDASKCEDAVAELSSDFPCDEVAGDAEAALFACSEDFVSCCGAACVSTQNTACASVTTWCAPGTQRLPRDERCDP